MKFTGTLHLAAVLHGLRRRVHDCSKRAGADPGRYFRIGANMTLEDWDKKVSPHLQFIEAGAAMVMRHVNALPLQPGFETMAEDEMRRTREVLQEALTKIVIAQNSYLEKPLETA